MLLQYRMDGTLLETSSSLLPQEKIESLQPEGQIDQPAADDVQQLTFFWKNFLNSTSEPTRVNRLQFFLVKILQKKLINSVLNFRSFLFLVLILQVEWLELFMYKFEVLISEPEFIANNEQ